MTTLTHFKAMALTLLIAIGFAAQCSSAKAGQTETIIVAGGCFWCVEADFEKVKGVKSAVSGFSGGKAVDPSYKQVVKGGTGHLESVKITFDPSVITARQLYDLFFRSVDPTDAGGQFCDRGPTYRTAIFAQNPAQKNAAEEAKSAAQSALGAQIVTPILPASPFYPAGDYHQDYYKGSKIILTRFGPKSKASAYKAYRKACGRDARVKQLWGSAAAFAG